MVSTCKRWANLTVPPYFGPPEGMGVAVGSALVGIEVGGTAAVGALTAWVGAGCGALAVGATGGAGCAGGSGVGVGSVDAQARENKVTVKSVSTARQNIPRSLIPFFNFRLLSFGLDCCPYVSSGSRSTSKEATTFQFNIRYSRFHQIPMSS